MFVIFKITAAGKIEKNTPRFTTAFFYDSVARF